MSEIKKKNKRHGRILLIFPALATLALVLAELMRGHNIALFNPKGLISLQQHRLLLISIGLLLIIAVPSVLFLFYTAWHFRESNPRATHAPDTHHGKYFNAGIWILPSIFMVIMAVILISATYKLVPQKPIVSVTKPLVIQVISMRWKWVFIYPEQNIATVNYVKLPVLRPVRFDLTADDAPMSSFWIPNLGGQLYSMTGMVNKLNLMPYTPGSYPGSSAEINGAGFAGMRFTAQVSSNDEFNRWVQRVKQNKFALNDESYAELLKPSENNPPVLYSSAQSDLYDKVLMKYMDPSHDKMDMMANMGHMEHEVN